MKRTGNIQPTLDKDESASVNGVYAKKVIILDASGNQVVGFGGAELNNYSTNDVEEASSTLTYVGKEDKDGNWVVMKIDESSGTSIQYATVTNNSGTTTYSDAWTNRASLTYNDYSTAF